MENFQTECTPDDHNHIITDVRFRPNSTQLATSSFDKTVRIWDAAKVCSLPFLFFFFSLLLLFLLYLSLCFFMLWSNVLQRQYESLF